MTNRILVALPTEQLYRELTDYVCSLPCVLEPIEIVSLAVCKHFQGKQLDLHSDPLFQTQGRTTSDVDFAVGIAEDAMVVAATLLSNVFNAAGIDPRQISNVEFLKKDLVIQLGDEHGSTGVTEGIHRCLVPDRFRTNALGGGHR